MRNQRTLTVTLGAARTGANCSLDEIRAEAGFTSAFNLNDSLIFQYRQSAQSEINTALGSIYTVPFKPVPEIIPHSDEEACIGDVASNDLRRAIFARRHQAERSTRMDQRLTEPSRQPASKRTRLRLK